MACSSDSPFSHFEFCKKERKFGGIGNCNIPLISDQSHTIAAKYGCLITSGPQAGTNLRGTYIIDPKGVLRHASVTDLPVGRDVCEVLRLVQAFKYTDTTPTEVCPASWVPGKPTMVPQPDNKKTADYFEKVHSKPTPPPSKP